MNGSMEADTSGKTNLEREWPGLIGLYYSGDVHVHCSNTNRGVEGAGPKETVHKIGSVLRYAACLGLKFVAFSDHSSNPGDPTVLDYNHPICRQILKEAELIKGYPSEIAVYSGIEANILIVDGEAVVDVPPDVLEKLDWRVASIHEIKGANKRDPSVLRALLLAAIENPEIDAIGHPYRYVEFYPHDWKSFLEAMRTMNPQAYSELSDIERDKDWASVKKIIGRIDLNPEDTELVKFRSLFENLEKQYWDVWDEVLRKMAETGTVFEINLNSFRPGKSFYQKLITMAGNTPGLMFSLVTDFHNITQHNHEKSEDLYIGELDGLPRALNTRNAVRKLLATINLMENAGITPDRVVNSSHERFVEFMIERIYIKDQADRVDWSPDKYGQEILAKDRIRIEKVKRILGYIKADRLSGETLFYAGMIFQHGEASEDYCQANKLADLAIGKGEERGKWLYAASKDRYLLSIGKPQMYGTQFSYQNGKWVLSLYDAGVDEKRAQLGLSPFSEVQKQLESLNAAQKTN